MTKDELMACYYAMWDASLVLGECADALLERGANPDAVRVLNDCCCDLIRKADAYYDKAKEVG